MEWEGLEFSRWGPILRQKETNIIKRAQFTCNQTHTIWFPLNTMITDATIADLLTTIICAYVTVYLAVCRNPLRLLVHPPSVLSVVCSSTYCDAQSCASARLPIGLYFDGVIENTRNPCALAMELRLFCIKPSMCAFKWHASMRTPFSSYAWFGKSHLWCWHR